jgi:hypothetical protein
MHIFEAVQGFTKNPVLLKVSGGKISEHKEISTGIKHL